MMRLGSSVGRRQQQQEEEEKEGGAVWVCRLSQRDPCRPDLREGCARKQTTSNWQTLQTTHCTVSTNYLHTPQPPFQNVNLWVSERSCPPKCAPATALRRPRHAPLPSCSLNSVHSVQSVHSTLERTLNGTLPTPSLAPSFSSTHRPFLPPADTSRPTAPGLNSCGTNMM